MDFKIAAREMEHIDKDYETLWRKEDESFPHFIPIRPRIVDGELGRHESQTPYALIDSNPLSQPLLAPLDHFANFHF